MYVFCVKYTFSLQQLAKQRLKFQHKICYRPANEYLKLKSTPTTAITSRLFRDGNFLRLYKQCQKSFVVNLLKIVKTLPHNNEFKNLYLRYYSFKDFNRILFWKIMSINSLFNLKRLKNKKLMYYLRSERRAVLVLLWLKNLVKLRKKDHFNCTVELFQPILKFICDNRSVNEVFNLKLTIYKLRMMRG